MKPSDRDTGRDGRAGTGADSVEWLTGWERRLNRARGTSQWGGGETTRPGVSTLPYCILPEEVVEFLLELDRHRLMRTDYRRHADRLRPAIEDPARIETLSAEDCLLLLTWHVRTDRFVDGHLAEVLDRGDVTAILRRLVEINEGSAGSASG